MNISTINTETYAGVALRARTLCMTAGPRFEWIDAPTPAVRPIDVTSATSAGRNLNIHASSKQARPPREDLR